MRSRVAALALACALALALGGGMRGSSTEARATPVARSSIVGGGPAYFPSWEFAAVLFRNRHFTCSASVIAPTKILTAAHCVFGVRVTGLSVVTGRPRLTNTSVGERFDVVSKAVHPSWARTHRYDLAVLTLSSPTSSPAVAVPATREEAAALTALGTRLRVAGWGARNPRRLSLPFFLKKTNQRVRAPRRCRRGFGPIFVARAMICALGKPARFWSRRFGLRIHTAPCSGDSGGPLVADSDHGPRIVGVTSYGAPLCGRRFMPNVFARVGDALGFVDANL